VLGFVEPHLMAGFSGGYKGVFPASRFFCGDVLAAHGAGCAYSRETAMVRCERPFPVVVRRTAAIRSIRISTRRSRASLRPPRS
jgi:nickel-dependent lactate racemase